MARAKAKNNDSLDELRCELEKLGKVLTEAIEGVRKALQDVAALSDEKFRVIDLRLFEIENGEKIRKAAIETEQAIGITK